MEDITLRTGVPHVTSAQHRAIIAAIVGNGSYIANQDELLEPELAANNVLKIRSGILIHHGCVGQIPTGTYDQVTYLNGNQAMKRIDLVVRRYTRVSGSDYESGKWVVIQGTPAESDPEVPAHTVGNMQNGDLVDDCPIFELHFDGINVTEVKKLVELSNPMSELVSLIYPIGSIYMSVNNVNPSLLFGGTWEPWGAGKVPIGVDSSDADFSTVEKTGGGKTKTHKHTTAGHAITMNEMPNHSHHMDFGFYGQEGSGEYLYTFDLFANESRGIKTLYTSTTGSGKSHGHGDTGSTSVDVVQPYITCYMWKRTA